MEIIEKLNEKLHEQVAPGFPKLNLKVSLASGVKGKINREFGKLLKPIYFTSIPLGDLMDICEKYGVIVIMEDYRRWSGLLVGREGTVYFDLADKKSETEYKGDIVYTSIFKNARLALQWYKMPSGKYEITSYVG